MKHSKRNAMAITEKGRRTEKLKYLKARVCAKVEHPFHVIKNLFRPRNTRYLSLAKNTPLLSTLFAFANLVLAGRRFTVNKTRKVP